uniref:Vesicle-fusing ATPase n=1 Tax=Oryza barthii TaxID=65489 RepID=A0A0D3EJF3_9ORYZ
MYGNFKEQAIEYVKQAVQEDNGGNYVKAFPLYMNALEYFKTHLKYEKDPKIKDAIAAKFTEYLRRAEEIRAVLDGHIGGGGGGDSEQAKLRGMLRSAIVAAKPSVKWSDVAGLESAKEALQEAAILPIKFPHFFTGKRRPWKAFLLYGPPGTGNISSSDLVSKWMGESKKLVANLFQMARENAPSIIFIDEIDSLCGQRGECNENEASRRIKTELLVQMQGFDNSNDKVLVLAATNMPHVLDQAMRRRFDKCIYIPLPDLKARKDTFKIHIGDTPHSLTEDDFESLAYQTEGFSGSDIAVCILLPPISKIDFDEVLVRQGPTLDSSLANETILLKRDSGITIRSMVNDGDREADADGRHNFKEQAIEYVKQAVQEDNAGNYVKAFPLYMNALEYFKTHLKYEKNPKIKEAITAKFTEYLRRAEEIRAVLDEGGGGGGANGGDAAVATRPKTKGKDGEGGGDDSEQSKLRAGLNSAIITEKPNIKWNDVAGLESAKQALQEAVILPVKFPQFFTGKRRPWRAFLLYGPPGTGKSYLAKAVATEADSTFFSISSSDLVSKWMGESEKLVANLFQMARENAPSIIFIDEIDSLCGQRGEGNESEASRRIKTELLVQMQGVGHNDDKVLVLAATNTPYALDQAVRRRFDKRIYIPLPDLKARQHMFKVHLGDTPHNLNESDFESLARRTDGFSGSDIAVCVKDVLFEPVRKTQDAMFFFKADGDMWMPCGPKQSGAVQTTMQELASKGLAAKILPPPISRTDFEKVLARQRPTVSKKDLEVHERFTKEFGEEG